MPLIYTYEIRPGTVYAIWEVTESEAVLRASYSPTPAEQDLLDSFTHLFRKTQFLASRLLLRALLPGHNIQYDTHGKPWPALSGKIRHDVHISVSHSGSYIAMMADTVKCGIDLETIRPKIEKIKSKFLSESELQQVPQELSTEYLHVYWCVKEALYKVYGKKNVSLRTDIFVDKVSHPQKGIVHARLTHEGEILERDVQYERFRDCVLAWTE